MRPPRLIYLSTNTGTGVRTGCHYLISMPVRLSVCVTLADFTDCESCTKPICTNPGSMEAGEYGLTRGMRFVARRLKVVSVAGLSWISWCILGGSSFFVIITFSIIVFFFERTRRAASMRPSCLI